jgi:hypothetical protein
MAIEHGHRTRRVRACQGVLVGLVAATIGGAAVAGQAPNTPPALSITVKGSPAYGQPTTVPIKTALFVVTPRWEGLDAKTLTGGREASGQALWVTDAVAFLSNREMNCDAAFSAKNAAPEDFLIALGRAEAYLPKDGWLGSELGKLFADAGSEGRKITLDRLSVEANYTSSKARRSGKDNLRGSDARLVLEQTAGGWMADILVKVDDLTAEGKLPLTSCGVMQRGVKEMKPLLGEGRLQAAADRFGM